MLEARVFGKIYKEILKSEFGAPMRDFRELK
jgi:hypothetical protein